MAVHSADFYIGLWISLTVGMYGICPLQAGEGGPVAVSEDGSKALHFLSDGNLRMDR